MKIGSKAHKKRRKSKIAWRMQAVISTISVSLLLILMGLVVLLSLTARVVADSVKENLTVTLVLNDDVQTQQAVHLLDSLNNMHYVSGIDYISREQALQEQIENMGLDPTEFLGTNPFAISMEMRVKPEFSSADSLQWISQELRRSDLVADVMYQKDLVESLNRNLHRASYFLLAVALLLVIISLSLISNVGAGLDTNIGPQMSWADLSVGIKWLCSFLMLVGRLEIIAVLVLFTRAFWKEN